MTAVPLTKDQCPTLPLDPVRLHNCSFLPGIGLPFCSSSLPFPPPIYPTWKHRKCTTLFWTTTLPLEEEPVHSMFACGECQLYLFGHLTRSHLELARLDKDLRRWSENACVLGCKIHTTSHGSRFTIPLCHSLGREPHLVCLTGKRHNLQCFFFL